MSKDHEKSWLKIQCSREIAYILPKSISIRKNHSKKQLVKNMIFKILFLNLILKEFHLIKILQVSCTM